jgi:hypothetical protein
VWALCGRCGRCASARCGWSKLGRGEARSVGVSGCGRSGMGVGELGATRVAPEIAITDPAHVSNLI